MLQAIDECPFFAVLFARGESARTSGGGVIPPTDECFDALADVRLKGDDALGCKGVGDDLALAGVLSAVAGVEESAADGYESVVEFGFGCSASML